MRKQANAPMRNVVLIDEDKIQGHLGQIVRGTVEKTLACYVFPKTYWRRIRTNNPLKRLMREIG